jgi:DNA modification methylase
MLSWVGKRALREVQSFPAQLVERYPIADPTLASDVVDWSEWPERYARGGILFHGDNKEVLAHLLANGFRGTVDLVYIDPPFDSGADYVREVVLRGASGSARLDGEAYSLGEQVQYTDIWANDAYLQFMYERLLLIKALLKPDSSVVLHTDYHRTHQLRMLMDEVFGSEAFVNELVWHYPDNFQGNVRGFASNHDLLLWYGFGAYPWNKPQRELERRVRRPTRVWDAATARLVLSRDAEGRPIYRDYDEASFDDVLTIPQRSVVVPGNADYTGYPTAKPPALLELLVSSLSPVGGLILDCFVGSGTTALAAQRLGRRWIAADINKGAIQTTAKRLATSMTALAQAAEARQTTLDNSEAAPEPAQFSFSVYRVNEYDLAIQHNEAVNLAVEHLGVTRSRTDPFFDGTLGNELVKIVAFDHPCGPVDLQAIASELDARPDDPRDAVAVAYGRELSCEQWVADWNRHRPVNKIRIIELRNDPKHGGFFSHRPASARVTLELGRPASGLADGSRHGRLSIDEFVSPTILDRLARQEGVLAVAPADWRSMVDSVAIDLAYDTDAVFTVHLQDVPEKRSDTVDGIYEVDIPTDSSHVAIKLTDMLGEETLVVLAVPAAPARPAKRRERPRNPARGAEASG